MAIAHVDMDAFYVSVELRRRPELKGLPVVVAGTGPRAVVTTSSYEARKFGVFSATPASRARRLCPDAVFVPPDFNLYRARSKEVMAVLREHFDRVQTMGLDEAYIDLDGIERPKAALRRLKSAILERTGLGCSVGVGPTKLIAKVASDAEKPDGFVVLSRDEARQRFAGSGPTLVPGIGPKTGARLAERGVRTLAQLAELPEQQLVDWFGANHGPYLRSLARFDHDSPVTTVSVAKSESRETTFDTDLNALDEMAEVIARLSEQLCDTLVRDDRRGATVGIKVRLDDFSTHTRARTLPEAVNQTEAVKRVALALLREFDPPRPVRLLGVRVAGLDKSEAGQTPDDQLVLTW